MLKNLLNMMKRVARAMRAAAMKAARAMNGSGGGYVAPEPDVEEEEAEVEEAAQLSDRDPARRDAQALRLMLATRSFLAE